MYFDSEICIEHRKGISHRESIFGPATICLCRLLFYLATIIKACQADLTEEGYQSDMSTSKLSYVEELKDYQLTSAVACCELIPFELTSPEDFDFVEDFLYTSDTDQYQYPSASASYSENDCEQNFVNLLDTDFLDIYDELAKEDDRFEFGPSPVAMPIVYAVSDAEFMPTGVTASPIQHATLIEFPNEKQSSETVDVPSVSNADCIKEMGTGGNVLDCLDKALTLESQRCTRNLAILKWKMKKSQIVHKSASDRIKSARQEATARRPRSHGKFNKVKAKWVAATEYFQSAVHHGVGEEKLIYSNT